MQPLLGDSVKMVWPEIDGVTETTKLKAVNPDLNYNFAQPYWLHSQFLIMWLINKTLNPFICNAWSMSKKKIIIHYSLNRW